MDDNQVEETIDSKKVKTHLFEEAKLEMQNAFRSLGTKFHDQIQDRILYTKTLLESSPYTQSTRIVASSAGRRNRSYEISEKFSLIDGALGIFNVGNMPMMFDIETKNVALFNEIVEYFPTESRSLAKDEIRKFISLGHWMNALDKHRHLNLVKQFHELVKIRDSLLKSNSPSRLVAVHYTDDEEMDQDYGKLCVEYETSLVGLLSNS